MMRAIEERMIDVGLPYKVFGGPRFYERKEIRDAIAYLRLIRQPDDDLAFERIINVPKRGIGQTTVAKVLGYARMNRISAMRSIEVMIDTDELPAAARKKLVAFQQLIGQWRELMTTMPHNELAEQVLEDSGYREMWRTEKTADARGRLENLDELVGSMGNFENLAGFLEHISLVLDTNAGSGGDELSLMTLHAAKGMEFPVVFLPRLGRRRVSNYARHDRKRRQGARRGAPPRLRWHHARAPGAVHPVRRQSRSCTASGTTPARRGSSKSCQQDLLDVDDISGASMPLPDPAARRHVLVAWGRSMAAGLRGRARYWRAAAAGVGGQAAVSAARTVPGMNRLKSQS